MSTGVYKRTKPVSQETRNKISLANKGKKRSPEVIEKYRNRMLGTHLSEETKRKISESEKGKKMSEESKQKIRDNHARWNLGKKTSEETRKKLSESHKGITYPNRKTGYSTKRKGFVMPEETKEKIRQTKLKNKEYYSNWKGGISIGKNKTKYYTFKSKQRSYRRKMAVGDFSLEEWELLKKQYNHTCPCCKLSEPEINLTIDHIIPLIKGGTNNLENIQPLCLSCNCKKHTKTIKYDYK